MMPQQRTTQPLPCMQQQQTQQQQKQQQLVYLLYVNRLTCFM
jgi:hypothetical protein